MKIERNEPCPCGSGKKYKMCCLNAKPAVESQMRLTPRFQLEPGSYGGHLQYMPSVVCYEQIAPGKWSEYFCLVNPAQLFDAEDDASAQAKTELNNASALNSASGSDADFAMSLKKKGYVAVKNFRIVKD